MRAKRHPGCGVAIALVAACVLTAVSSHSHEGHTCIHDSIVDAATHEHDSEKVQLLRHAEGNNTAGEPTAVTMTRRELEMIPELADARKEHARRLQSNAPSYLARPWGGLRIHVEYVNVTGPGQDPGMTSAKADLLQNQILPGVVAKLRSVLEVRAAVLHTTCLARLRAKQVAAAAGSACRV